MGILGKGVNMLAKDNKNLTPIEIPDNYKQVAKQLNTPEMQSYLANQARKQFYDNLSNNIIKDIPYRNPNEGVEQLLEKGNQELYSIHYEDKKTNAQLQTLLKIVDSQTDEIERLKSVNQELQKINSVLEEERKHSTRNTVIWTIVTGIILLCIEHWKDIYNFILSLIK